jgi:hypothetical protein
MQNSSSQYTNCHAYPVSRKSFRRKVSYWREHCIVNFFFYAIVRCPSCSPRATRNRFVAIALVANEISSSVRVALTFKKNVKNTQKLNVRIKSRKYCIVLNQENNPPVSFTILKWKSTHRIPVISLNSYLRTSLSSRKSWKGGC